MLKSYTPARNNNNYCLLKKLSLASLNKIAMMHIMHTDNFIPYNDSSKSYFCNQQFVERKQTQNRK